MKSFKIEIMTPDRTVYTGEAESLVLDGEQGSFGILAGHAPLVARLRPGRVLFTKDGKDTAYDSGAGFVRVSRDCASILLDKATESVDLIPVTLKG